jgi:hypothetical protein
MHHLDEEKQDSYQHNQITKCGIMIYVQLAILIPFLEI